jgi:hypothetical protein
MSATIRGPWASAHEAQYQTLRRWFLDRYVHPETHSRWDERARSYRYPYGGPYRANDCLKAAWGTRYSTVFLERTAVRISLEEGCVLWTTKRTTREELLDDDSP